MAKAKEDSGLVYEAIIKKLREELYAEQARVARYQIAFCAQQRLIGDLCSSDRSIFYEAKSKTVS
ncbi:MAG TPA: hypothetical protein V6D20_19310 [Candidatus Obscuribacterales bacterium]